jgi:hypothetical protein
MRTPSPVLLVLMLTAALAQPAASLTIDNFEEGNFNVVDDTTSFPLPLPIPPTPTFTDQEVAGLATSNVIGGVRLVRSGATGETVGVATSALATTPADDNAAFSYLGDGGTADFSFIYDGIANGVNDGGAGALGLDLSAFTNFQIDATAVGVTATVGVQLFTTSNSQISSVPLVNGATLIPLSNFTNVNLADVQAIRVRLSGIDPGEVPLISNISLPVPEPAAGLLVAAGLVVIGMTRKRG